MSGIDEGNPYSQHGEQKEKERPMRFAGRGKRREIEGYYFNSLWKVGESPSPYVSRSDLGDHEPFFLIERSGEARRGVWALLRFAKEHAPSWLEDDVPVRVFIPHIYLGDVAGDPIAFVEIEGKRFKSVAGGAGGVRFTFDPVFSVDCCLAEAHSPVRKPQTWSPQFQSRVVHYGLRRVRERRAVKQLGGNLETRKGGGIDKGQDALCWLIRESLRVAGGHNTTPRSLWPEARAHAVCITHEVSEPLRIGCIENILNLEKERGVLSTWFLSGERPVRGRNDDIIDRIRSSGNEIGLLGDVYGSMLAFRSDIFNRHYLDRCEKFIKRWDVRGFRSSAMMSSAVQRTILNEFDLFDTSTQDIDPFYPDVPERGCRSVHPYRINGIPEIPVTLPTAETLLTLGMTSREVMDLWRLKLDWIREMEGVAVFRYRHDSGLFGIGRKPDLADRLSLYKTFLDSVQNDDNAWIAPMAAVADRCREI